MKIFRDFRDFYNSYCINENAKYPPHVEIVIFKDEPSMCDRSFWVVFEYRFPYEGKIDYTELGYFNDLKCATMFAEEYERRGE